MGMTLSTFFTEISFDPTTGSLLQKLQQCQLASGSAPIGVQVLLCHD